jgi:DUF4097 and DUF4098 domain-containing protein YvlB
MIRRALLFSLLVLTASSAAAKIFQVTDKRVYELSVFPAAQFQIDNTDGDVEIIGTDDTSATLTVTRTIRGLDENALAEGQKMTVIALTGDERKRFVRTWLSPLRTPRWTANVSYSVRLPRMVQASVLSNNSNRILVKDMRGAVSVKNINGGVVLDGILGPMVVESGNGNILFHTPSRLGGNIQLTTVNGTIQVVAPPASAFNWVADSLRGDIRTTLPAQGRFEGTAFRGYINEPGPATLATKSLLGNVIMLRTGATAAESVPLRQVVPQVAQLPPTRGMRRPLVEGFFQYETTMGDVVIGEIRGDTKIATGAGAVQLGIVTGSCYVQSNGGPINLGRILGELDAQTAGGDVIVNQARLGGVIRTGGGIIRLMSTNGPTRLNSGGGDIAVTTTSSVIAETRSGDILITLDRGVKRERIEAKTAKGNVVVTVGPQFGADVDATVLTSDPNANFVRTDWPQGLSVQRDQVGNKTRIRATGKINGGGERLELFAEDGGIQITTGTANR